MDTLPRLCMLLVVALKKENNNKLARLCQILLNVESTIKVDKRVTKIDFCVLVFGHNHLENRPYFSKNYMKFLGNDTL